MSLALQKKTSNYVRVLKINGAIHHDQTIRSQALAFDLGLQLLVTRPHFSPSTASVPNEDYQSVVYTMETTAFHTLSQRRHEGHAECFVLANMFTSLLRPPAEQKLHPTFERSSTASSKTPWPTFPLMTTILLWILTIRLHSS